MGWKNLKEHYRIGHIVCVTEKGICIGSGYVHDLIIVNPTDGSLQPNKEMGWSSSNEDLKRYRQEMQADPAKVRALIEAPDTFAASLPVYTYDYDGNIVEKRCEDYGWPNQTHDGDLMYDNTFFATRDEALEKAKREIAAAIEMNQSTVARMETDLQGQRRRLHGYQTAAAKLADGKAEREAT